MVRNFDFSSDFCPIPYETTDIPERLTLGKVYDKNLGYDTGLS
jgi:hypothetical protein